MAQQFDHVVTVCYVLIFKWNSTYCQNLINPFQATVLLLYPLKTSENQRFRGVFMGYGKKPVELNWLTEENFCRGIG